MFNYIYIKCYIGKYSLRHKRNVILFIALIVGLMFCFFYSINNYNIIDKNNIERHNIVGQINKKYKYSDIKRVFISDQTYIGRYPRFSYVIFFEDGYKINLIDSVLGNRNTIENIVLIDNLIDSNILREKSIINYYEFINTIPKENRDKYIKILIVMICNMLVKRILF